MRTIALVSMLMVFVGCGDPLVEGDYRGQPLFELRGTIKVQDDLSTRDAEAVRVALLWVGADQHDSVSQGRSESAFPARYVMQVYSLPPNRAMRPVTDTEGLYGLARIVLYVDADGDEVLAPTERIVGASDDQVLTYFTSSQPTSLVEGPLLTGYQVMKLHTCADRLEGTKAMLGPVPTENAVDLKLEAGTAERLTDLDCDSVADDWCYDLRLQVQANPDDDDLLGLYHARCDVAFDPEFNNTAETSDGGIETNNSEVPLCEREPQHDECDKTVDGEAVIGECKPLLAAAVGTGEADQREAYWRFSECTGEFDPCAAVEWAGGEDRWHDYQRCVFEALPFHHQAWCHDIKERLPETEGEDRQYLESEFERADCSLVI